MSGQSGDSSVIGDWVRKQLEAGDDLEVLKTVLKNRGMDSDIVGRVLSSLKKNPLAEKAEVPAAKPEKTYNNGALKSEVEKIFSDNRSDIESDIESSNMNCINGAELTEIPERNTTADAVKHVALHKRFIKGKANKYVLKKASAKNVANVEMNESQLKEPHKAAEFESGSIPEEESIFSLFVAQVRSQVSRIKFSSPKITEYLFDTRIVIFTGIAIAILLIALFASFGLNWYADRMAQSVLK